MSHIEVCQSTFIIIFVACAYGCIDLQGTTFLSHLCFTSLPLDYSTKFLPFLKSNPTLISKEFSTKQKWEWANSIIFSRGFKDSDTNQPVLVLQGDMINHHFTPNAFVKWENNHFVVRVMENQSIEADQQVFIDYGTALSNSDLLSRYGFYLPNNPHNTVEIPTLLVADVFNFVSETKQAKKQKTESTEEEKDEIDADEIVDSKLTEAYYTIGVDGVAPSRLLHLISVLLGFTPSSTLDDSAASSTFTVPPAYSVDAYRFLHTLLRHRLSEFPTSIEEDELILRVLNESEAREKAAVVVSCRSQLYCVLFASCTV